MKPTINQPSGMECMGTKILHDREFDSSRNFQEQQKIICELQKVEDQNIRMWVYVNSNKLEKHI